ncbi:MAG TPA: serine/threonine protein kinase [Planctomycetaceae bacterium]|nr:serine/threonine protein kinase [Planctomycetaceae bacterium]HIQ20893.1 serine/threonine protein kinase [Planctomycetota bacterium]
MSPSWEQFVSTLARSGLMSARQVAELVERLPAQRRPRDSKQLARLLVRTGKLTKYQASVLYRGRTEGLVLGEYTVLEKIGAGGMGQVFKARHRTMDRVVALKVLAPHAVSSATAVDRFQREVRAAAKLMHPNIVTALDAGQHGTIHYLVMEYVDGQGLSQLLREQGPLPVGQAVEYILQAARGLQYAHSQGIVHRDVKPGNLLVDESGRVKILDMGLALLGKETTAEPGERLTGSNQALGTCDYMAPEQAEDTHAVDHRADIYSLGCTLYQLLTGRPLYVRDSLVKVILAHREAAIPSLCEARPDVPGALDEVFRKMVAKRPEDRFQSMEEVIVELERCVRPQPAVPGGAPSEASADPALASFLQSMAQAEDAKRWTTRGGHEETQGAQKEYDTHPSVGDGLPRPTRRRWLVRIGVAVALLGAGLASLWLIGAPRQPPVRLPPPLPPAHGWLILDWPQDQRQEAIVDIDGKTWDYAQSIDPDSPDRIRIPLPPGPHTLIIVRPGFRQLERRFVIEPGEPFLIEPRLERLGP